jgi:integrase
MAARSQGQVLERTWKSGRGYALRFRAYGERQYVTLGLESEGWDRDRADEELANILADVRRGIWVAPERKRRRVEDGSSEAPSTAPLFGPFAQNLHAARKSQVSPNHFLYLQWGLSHLLPYFANWPVSDIDVEAVDSYRAHKVEEAEAIQLAIDRGKPRRDERGNRRRPLSATSINKTIEVLQWVLSFAVEYKHLEANPAEGKRRRLPEPQRRPVYLDTAEHIEALLDAAEELDRERRFRCTERRAIIATFIFAGPRALEVGYMLWRDVDLANGRVFVGRSKTQAGLREIGLAPTLRDVLAAHKVRAYRSGPNDLVFPTGTGGRRDKDNLRCRILAPATERADQLLEERAKVPLPKGLSPHKLRHTFASVLIASGEDPASVMAQLGHTDPKFTLRVYTHLMRRDPAERARLKALMHGDESPALDLEAEGVAV